MNDADTLIVSIAGQKGGGGKSFVARLIAREFAAAKWNTKICDLDTKQGTTADWNRRRLENSIEPTISVETFKTVMQAIKSAPYFDLLIMDTPGYTSDMTLPVAKTSDYCLIPTGPSVDDLKPSVLLAHELIDKGIDSRKIAFILSKVGDSLIEINEARDYIKKAGYRVLAGELPYKTLYRRAVDSGKAPTEVSHPNLRIKAETVAQSIVNFVTNQESVNLKQEVELYGD